MVNLKISLLALFFLSFMIIQSVSATDDAKITGILGTLNVSNGTEFFTLAPFTFNVTTNNTVANCTIHISNFTAGLWTSFSSGWNMTNTTEDCITKACTNGTEFTNVSTLLFPNALGADSPWRRITASCMYENVTNSTACPSAANGCGPKIWFNTSQTGPFMYFKINEFGNNSVTITSNIINYKNYTTSIFRLEAHTSKNVTNCTYIINNNGTFNQSTYNFSGQWTDYRWLTGLMGNQSNGTINRVNFTNTTAIVFDHHYGGPNYTTDGLITPGWPINITFICFDAFQNKVTHIFNQSNQSRSSTYYFGLDTENPIISNYSLNDASYGFRNFTITNQSIWTFRFNFSDANPYICGMKFYPLLAGTGGGVAKSDETQNYTFTTGISETNRNNWTMYAQSLGNLDGAVGNSMNNCTFTFDIGKLTDYKKAGAFKLVPYAKDIVGQGTIGAYNYSGVIHYLKSGWNLITYMGANSTHFNETAKSFVTNHCNNCTSISTYSNLYGNFTTYSSSAPTINAKMNLTPGTPFYVYTSGDTWLISLDAFDTTSGSGNATMQPRTDYENVTLYTNYTARTATDNKTMPWNIIGLLNNVTMNQTVNLCTWTWALNGTTEPKEGFGYLIADEWQRRAGLCNTTYTNITYASWPNPNTGYMVSCKRGVPVCSTGAILTHPVNVSLPYGAAVWIYSLLNVTINRTAIY